MKNKDLEKEVYKYLLKLSPADEYRLAVLASSRELTKAMTLRLALREMYERETTETVLTTAT